MHEYFVSNRHGNTDGAWDELGGRLKGEIRLNLPLLPLIECYNNQAEIKQSKLKWTAKKKSRMNEIHLHTVHNGSV